MKKYDLNMSSMNKIVISVNQESILPRFHFSGFPIFAFKKGKNMYSWEMVKLISKKFSVSEEKKFGKIDSCINKICFLFEEKNHTKY